MDEKELTCVVCSELPPGQVHSCHDGHLFCVACWNAVGEGGGGRACTECSKPLAFSNRSIAAEKLISALPRTCAHCGEEATLGHERACALRPAAGSTPPREHAHNDGAPLTPLLEEEFARLARVSVRRVELHGTLTYPGGDTYVGEYVQVDDEEGRRLLAHGIGTRTFGDGAEYVGPWQDGKKHGEGLFTYANGDKYVGHFEDDVYSGEGIWNDANGYYVGQWKDGKEHGAGTFIGTLGDKCHKYVGQYKDGERNGEGTWNDANGDYDGQWKDGKEHGAGTFIGTLGDPMYVGQYKDGKKHGEGTWTRSWGGKYVGQFEDGLFNGSGTYNKLSGLRYIGQWKDGYFRGVGKILREADGVTYVGDCRFKMVVPFPWEVVPSPDDSDDVV